MSLGANTNTDRLNLADWQSCPGLSQAPIHQTGCAVQNLTEKRLSTLTEYNSIQMSQFNINVHGKGNC